MALIIDDILLSPLKFTMWLGKKLRETGYQELTDESKIHEELLQLQMRYEIEEISKETYEKEEVDGTVGSDQENEGGDKEVSDGFSYDRSGPEGPIRAQ